MNEEKEEVNIQLEDFKKISRFVEDETNPRQILLNNYPTFDFLGLTPSEMHDIIYDPFGEGSDFQIKNVTNNILDQIPFFLLTEHLLLMIYRDKFAKLTPKGCLSIKYCNELLAKKIIEEDIYEGQIRKVTREAYFASIKAARIIVELGGLVLIKKNKMYLSQYALQLMQEKNRLELFQTIFEAYSSDFLWAHLDGFRSELIGQLGFVFSLSMLKYYGSSSRPISFYLDKYKRAFPQLENHLQDFPSFPKERQLVLCYKSRLFERFFEWFGLAKLDGKESIFEPGNNTYSKTNIVDVLFDTPELLNNFL